MKYFIPLLFLISLIACRENQTNNTSPDLEHDKDDILEYPDTSILSFFETIKDDSIIIEVEPYTYEKSFAPAECLPLEYVPLLSDYIPQTQSESTGAKPLRKISVNTSNYLLILVQQDDYGPIYYGMMFSTQKGTIYSSETLAYTWGDAGDSQEQSSILTTHSDRILVKKFIETCHSELVESGDEMIAENIDCSDSTYITTLTVKN